MSLSSRNWINSIFGKRAEVLFPEGWYTRGHDHDSHFKDENGFMRLKIKKGTFV